MKLSLFFLLVTIIAAGFAQEQQQSTTQPQPQSSPAQNSPTQVPSSSSQTPASQPPSSPAAPASQPPPPSPLPEEREGEGQGSPSSTINNANLVIVSTTNGPVDPPSTTPTPTTPSPTTTGTPSSSTAAPTTTTEPSTSTTRPTTTPAPVPTTPKFPENVGNWSVSDRDSTCVVVTAAIQVHLKRENASELVIDVPNTHQHVNITGDCGADRQVIVMDWYTMVNEVERENTLQLEFSKEQDNQYALSSVQFALRELPPGGHQYRGQITDLFFPTTLKRSFQCMANQELGTNDGSLYLRTEKLQFEAFRDNQLPAGEIKFSEADQCKADQCKADHKYSTGLILGIAVGIGLLIVACLALGIYLFKRCRRDGYQPLDAQT